MVWLFLACTTVGETPVVLASSPAPPVVAAAAADGGADRGARVFAQHCATCHGATGKGDGPAAAALVPGPADLSLPRPPEKRHPPSRKEIVELGSPGTAMPAFGPVLSAEDLAAVQDFVHTLAHGSGGGGQGGGQGGGRGPGPHGGPPGG